MDFILNKSRFTYENGLGIIRQKLNEHFGDYERLCQSKTSVADADWTLCEKGLLAETDLLSLYCAALEVQPLDEDELVEPEIMKEVYPDYLQANCCLPRKLDDNSVNLLVCDPYKFQHHEYMFSEFFNSSVSFTLARRSLVERLINKIYNQGGEEETDNKILDVDGDEDALRSLASEAKIVRLVNEMLSQALTQEASDIHVEPEENKLAIRFRIDGILREYLSCPLADYPAIASRIKLIGGLNIAESRLPQDGRTNFHVGRFDMDIRISTIPVMSGESIVMRILRKDAMAFDLEKLGMNAQLLKKFGELIQIPHGIVLVVGPTGSGKTTTLYSVMRQLNNSSRKIITIEDPVEYQLAGLSQMQVNPKIGLSFASGLRHIVRQDPDVILVGEIRDRETADIAINAALTGHLVFSTLHTNDAAGAVARLLDMGVENFLLSSALFGVLSQRLVRTVCKTCKGTGVNYNMTGNKCKVCNGTGFKGRCGIYELLTVDHDIRRAIMRNASSSQINKIAVESGMVSLLQDGLDKAKKGITTETEVKRSAND